MANVFISHRTADLIAAERLANDLTAAGHVVWIDSWKLHIGDSIVGEINKGLEGSTSLILCYSDAGVTSPWMSIEWMSTLARQLNGVHVKLLPVRLTGGTPPAILAHYKYADLVADWDYGLTQLLASIQ